VKLELKWISEGGGSQAKPPGPPSKRTWLPWILAAVILLAAAPFVVVYFRRAPDETRTVRSLILAPQKTNFPGIGNLAVRLSVSSALTLWLSSSRRLAKQSSSDRPNRSSFQHPGQRFCN
jgi:hypothetical protein